MERSTCLLHISSWDWVFTFRALYQETIEGYKEGIAKFSALGDRFVYTSNTDPAVEVPSGYNDKSGIGLWGKGGKIKVWIKI